MGSVRTDVTAVFRCVLGTGDIGSVEWCTGTRSSGEHTAPSLEYKMESRAALKMEGMCTAGVYVPIYIASYPRRLELSSVSPQNPQISYSFENTNRLRTGQWRP
jgi:hypothetical protein